MEVPQADLSALRRRLAMTQWPKKGDRPGFFPARAAGDRKSSRSHSKGSEHDGHQLSAGFAQGRRRAAGKHLQALRRPHQQLLLDTHGRVHQTDHEPVLFDTHNIGEASTCKLCGILVNGSYQHAHNQAHHADYEPFATASPGAAETYKLCGGIINSSYQEAHNRGHG
jgi:hypothetical protein